MPIGRAIQRTRQRFVIKQIGPAPPVVLPPVGVTALSGAYSLTGTAATLTASGVASAAITGLGPLGVPQARAGAFTDKPPDGGGGGPAGDAITGLGPLGVPVAR